MGLTGPFRLRELLLDRTGQNVTVAVPTGVLHPFAGATAPTGYLLCDGANVSRTTYATLFATISTTYGVGDGSTTFSLPDLRGRAPVGAGTDGTAQVMQRFLGEKFGDQREPAHNHTGTSDSMNQNATHYHTATTGYMNQNNIHGNYVMSPGGHSWGANFGGLSGYAVFTFSPAAIHSGIYGGSPLIMNNIDVNHQHNLTSDTRNIEHQHTFTTLTRGSGTSANQPPSVGVNYIIKT